jgi:hypothetical protein
MNRNPTITLLKKDFRLNRLPIFGGAALICMPYLVGFAVYLTLRQQAFSSANAREGVIACPQMALAVTYAMSAIFGGVAFAYERRERSGDFLAMIPVSRLRSIFSKSLISVGFLAPMWAINNFAAQFLQPIHPRHLYLISATAMLMCFGVAWLISSFQSSAAIAACTSIGLISVCALVLNAMPYHPLSRPDEIIDRLEAVIFCFIGVTSFVAGSIYYLYRIAP